MFMIRLNLVNPYNAHTRAYYRRCLFFSSVLLCPLLLTNRCTFRRISLGTTDFDGIELTKCLCKALKIWVFLGSIGLWLSFAAIKLYVFDGNFISNNVLYYQNAN